VSDTQTETITVPATPEGVASALRDIAGAIEALDLCLIGLWSTGFGEPWEAVIQVTFDGSGYPKVSDDVRGNGGSKPRPTAMP
jgi:hypothetical protein